MIPNGPFNPRRPFFPGPPTITPAAPPGFFAETHAAPPGFRHAAPVRPFFFAQPPAPGRPGLIDWGRLVPPGTQGTLGDMGGDMHVDPIEPMSTLEETRNTVGLSRVMLCHGGDSGDWFQVPPNTEVILFSKNGQNLYLPQMKGVLKWIRDTSRILPNKNMESLDGKQYQLDEAVGNENIKIKVSINSANLVKNTGPFEPIDTNSDISKRLRGLPAGSLCPDLIISANHEQELRENLDGSGWGTGPVSYPSGFVGIYYPNQVNITDPPAPPVPAIATAGIEKEATRLFRSACIANRAAGSPFLGGRLSDIIRSIRKYYVDNGLLQDGQIFRLFIPACSTDSAPPHVRRRPSMTRNFRGTLGRTLSTRAIAVGGVKRRKHYTRRIKKYRKKYLHKKHSMK